MHDNERLAILETKVEAMESNLLEINTKLDKVIEVMNKNKGFWAGVIAVGTGAGAILGALLDYLFRSS